ncbi:ferritin-1, chloroplastic-like [Setaria italica]|uniref:ferritin-1, chloroplastic-like n=1 Tax=Setaria italica TaxID=4555 RepID=UPI000BE5210C|nr:ferritin-1, chloroplastic-like [Setaria italica]
MGNNEYGQLGIGDTQDHNLSVDIAAGGWHSTALTNEGKLLRKEKPRARMLVARLAQKGAAMELALALEKLVDEKLHNLHVATRCNDPQLTDFIGSEFLADQVEDIKKISEYVAQLRRVGKGHRVWHFDLLEEEA